MRLLKNIALMMLLILSLSFPVHAKVKAPEMNCQAYVVMDAGNGKVLFGQDHNKKIYPASTAKLMTAIVCIEEGDENSKIKTSSKVLDGTTYGTFCLGLEPGRKFTFKDLLSLSLISSAADATDSLAAGVFGSREECVQAMNDKCAELGLKHTSFDNPVGSDIGAGFDKTYSTAREMALITRYAMAVPLIRETVRKPYYDTSSGQEIHANSTNWFIRGIASYDSDRYRIIGSKSGTTNAAGHVFIATAVDDEGHEVICGYFGGPYKESTFAGIRKLLNYTFKQYDKGKLTLTGKCDDVRISDMQPLFDTYAALNTYPLSKDGRFHPEKKINRPQLARLIKNVDATEGNPGMGRIARVWAGENRTGNVTAAEAASLIQAIYPSHLGDEEIDTILADCKGTETLDKDDKEAFAVFVKSGLLPDEGCKNARHLLSRKQGLVLADHLADYQIGYAARHPVGMGLLLPVSFDPASLKALDAVLNESAQETTTEESATADAASTQAAATAAADDSTQETATAESATADAASTQTAAAAESTTQAVAPMKIEILTTAPPMLWNYKWRRYYKKLAIKHQKEVKAAAP